MLLPLLMPERLAAVPSLPKKVRGILKKQQDINASSGSGSSQNIPRVGFYMDGAPSHTFYIPPSSSVPSCSIRTTQHQPHEINGHSSEEDSERNVLDLHQIPEHEMEGTSKTISRKIYKGAHAAVMFCLVAVCTYQVACNGGL